jgi:hypothetical protein
MKFEKFCLIRNLEFLQRMSEHVNLVQVITFLEQSGHAIKFDDFSKTFKAKIETDAYFIYVMNSAWRLVDKECQNLRAQLS